MSPFKVAVDWGGVRRTPGPKFASGCPPHSLVRNFVAPSRTKEPSGGARRRRRWRPPTASRLKGPRKQKSFAYKLLKRGLANLMSPTSTSGVAPPLQEP
ncbi:hypothetical protein EVAR_20256_1 [Eumeta japonica]|uniref:Uncharacterized protein n=1 Tax=Eumeta variegata TaxID=151549 RepID=A0A4C1W864_EUMVA|nr:hypothetical protein EVAR_20256_1 [Eumeta japonica]